MNKVYKSIISVAAAAIVAGATAAPALVNAWGDSNNGRPSYTISQINEGKLGNTITFNSISDGKIGDEKNFVGAKLSSSSSNVWNANEINVKDGETYTIRLYVHNNSPKGKDAVAKGVSAQISLPTTVGKSHTVIGYLNSSNATPTRYWDEVKLTSSEDFYIEYVKGSAKWTNAKLGTVALSDNVIIGGAAVGYEALNGEIPGCFEYDGVVTIQVKVHASVSSKLEKTVRIKGSGNQFTESVNAKIGDEVEFQIAYTNLLNSTAKDVMIRDILPTNMEYVKGSTYVYNSNHQNGVQMNKDTVTTSGINIGDYKTNGNAYVRFTAKVVDKTIECGSSNQLVNWASATVNSKVVKDDASVFVAGETCPVPDDEDPDPTPTPDPEPTPEPTPDTPEVIVKTGASEVVISALGAGTMVTLAGYAIASRKKM